MEHDVRQLKNSTAGRRAAVLLIAALLGAPALLTATAGPATAHSPQHTAHSFPAGSRTTVKPTVVLVHGAWADSGSWDAVVARLQAAGYRVDVFPTPLRTLSGDSKALAAYLGAIAGPIVLVGHSYGGAVITDAATGNDHVKALVYLDAFAPDLGRPVISYVGADSAVHDQSVFDVIGPDEDLYVRQGLFPADFANDLSRPEGRVLAATQRPIALAALTEPSTTPAWRSVPSWYEVGTIDRVIPEKTQLAIAHSIGAHVERDRTSHLPMVSDPAAVVRIIRRAARATE